MFLGIFRKDETNQRQMWREAREAARERERAERALRMDAARELQWAAVVEIQKARELLARAYTIQPEAFAGLDVDVIAETLEALEADLAWAAAGGPSK